MIDPLLRDVRTQLRAMDDSRGARRRFALALAIVSALVAAYAAYRERAVAGWIAGAASAALALAALLAPNALRPFHRAWMALSFALGWVTSRLLLTAVFALIVTPVALVARLVGKRFLDVKADPRQSSYWEKRDPARTIDHRKMSLEPPATPSCESSVSSSSTWASCSPAATGGSCPSRSRC